MAKVKTVYVCTECGYQAPRWMGQCAGCGAWNTMVEELQQPEKPAVIARSSKSGGIGVPIREVGVDPLERIPTHIGELDRVLSGGMIEGGVTLLGGEPGIGKSTLLLQACQNIAQSGLRVLYISGEESARQVAMRARRLHAESENLLVLSETDIDTMVAAIERCGAQIVVVDSIQTAYYAAVTSAPGSVAQVRESASRLIRLAKETGVCLVLVGHVTKEGALAGPRVLEHMVDTVLYFEGERQTAMRVLRSVKNRFGSTDEIGIFEMGAEGMRGVEDASAYLLESLSNGVAGVAVSCPMEGSRPVLCEVQALAVDSSYQNPRRVAQGVDFNRMVLLAAVLERRGGISLAGKDLYLNAAGGVRITEPSCDLAILGALASAACGLPIRDNTVLLGEVGLSGEVRHIGQMGRRIAECVRMGFTTIIAPQPRGWKPEDYPDAEIICVRDVKKALLAMLRRTKGKEIEA